MIKKYHKQQSIIDDLAVQKGSMLVFVIVGIFFISMIILGILTTATSELRVLRSTAQRELALQVSEAGVNYYQWHLAHFATDYADGTGQTCNPCGPYIHDYVDKDTNDTVGRFELTITPPSVGSTLVTIKSVGYSIVDTKNRRTVTARYGIPSLAKYAFLTNDLVWIGSSSSVSGQLHSNNGIRFDGTGNAPITSAKSTYTCPNSQGCSGNPTKAGIWGSAPAGTQAFWDFPLPTVDFSTMTADIATMKSDAQSSGVYLAPSSAQGYSLVFEINGGVPQVDIYRVTSLRAHQTGYDQTGASHTEDIDYQNRTLLFANQNYPANGIFYVEDKVWVEGTVGGRALVVSAKLPYNAATAPSVLIPNNILYAAKDGTVSLGLIGQKDVLITYYVPNNLEVDAALIAQNGSIQRYDFPGDNKTSITLYGSVMTFGRRVLNWVGSSGFPTINTIYDGYLLYAPPPSFPLTADGYQQISWSSD